MRALNVEQMRAVEEAGRKRLGDLELMRAAGERLAEAIQFFAPEKARVVAFAGPGDNGGDALAALARLGRERHSVIYAMPARSPSAARRDAETRARAAGVEIHPLPTTAAEASRVLEGGAFALDALLGTGSRGAPDGAMAPVIEALNSWVPEAVLAVDVPTGVDATTGEVAPNAVRAGITLSFGALKVGTLLEPGRDFAGDIYLGFIGLDPEIEALGPPYVQTLSTLEWLAAMPERDLSADKRAAGSPLVVAGSRQFPGAAVLCARGAARSGAGYVTVATPNEAADLLRMHLVEQVVVGFDSSDVAGSVATLLDLTNHCGAVALGPGLGLDERTGEIVRGFVSKLDLPFVADASALFHFAKHLDILRGKRCVLTPHAREFARLSGGGTVAPGARVTRLREFVARTGIVTLLKGRATLIDDGTTTHVNMSGTNALATAGTGDVLTGTIATLLAQGLTPVDAARVGACWHGLAGQAAEAERTLGVVAGDVLDGFAPAYDSAHEIAAEVDVELGFQLARVYTSLSPR
jgi:NAD(P)H-hydrate epimerase